MVEHLIDLKDAVKALNNFMRFIDCLLFKKGSRWLVKCLNMP